MHIVITGVSRGLGAAMTSEFISAGHQVSGCCRSTAAVEQLNEQHGPQHGFHAVDVTDLAAVTSWARQVEQRAGAAELLLNNAGLANRPGDLWEVDPAEFSQLIDINIKGVFHVLTAFLPAMISQAQGVVVNFSSGWGRSTSPSVAPYCASKWAIEGLSQALASEVPAGISVVALNPGIIDTEMLQRCFGEQASSYENPAEWVQRAVPYLLSLGPDDNGRQATVPG
jgi:NAD(P)-dependent dehydrogenase (short-subunit alcohol dehydrogenase family)